jgi:hypothetical protein
MQQRQPRLGDILDDYCPRERRLTNHAVVAMVGEEVRQTRCTTCDAEHEYKHAKMPRPRKKSDSAAIAAQVLAKGPKRVVHEAPVSTDVHVRDAPVSGPASEPSLAARAGAVEEPPAVAVAPPARQADTEIDLEEGPVHRPLIRAQLPRPEGQAPVRPGPDFTIRQPVGRPGRFRSRYQRGGQFHGSRPSGNTVGPVRGGGRRPHDGRTPLMSHMTRQHRPPHKRSK